MDAIPLTSKRPSVTHLLNNSSSNNSVSKNHTFLYTHILLHWDPGIVPELGIFLLFKII